MFGLCTASEEAGATGDNGGESDSGMDELISTGVLRDKRQRRHVWQGFHEATGDDENQEMAMRMTQGLCNYILAFLSIRFWPGIREYVRICMLIPCRDGIISQPLPMYRIWYTDVVKSRWTEVWPCVVSGESVPFSFCRYWVWGHDFFRSAARQLQSVYPRILLLAALYGWSLWPDGDG